MSCSRAGRVPVGGRRSLLLLALAILAGTFVLVNPLGSRASAAVNPMVFPLDKRVTVTHQFMSARSGHPHQGIDLFVAKLTKIRAVVSGTVTLQVRTYNGLPWYTLWLAGDDGHGYYYSHLNNDSPGTDDGRGGLRWAFAPGVVTGTHVTKGQFIAYSGDSGNAENTSPHLHFQVHESTALTSVAVDPYDSLFAAPLASGAPAPAWPAYSSSRVDNGSSSITYLGSWTTVAQSGAIGSSYKSGGTDAGAIIWFEGTRASLVCTKDATHGIALVSLDGGPARAVDLYSPTVTPKRTVWTSGTLPAGTHTILVTWSGKKSVSGAGTRINIDAVDLKGRILQAPKITLSQQTNSLFSYAGAWKSVSTGSASGGSLRSLDSAGSVTAQFTGTYAGLIARQGPANGRATVTVDGGSPQTVDFYASHTLNQRNVWNTGVLRYGVHVVKIEWTGAKRPASTDTGINIDALQVIGGFNAVGSVPWEGPTAGKTIPAPTPGLNRYEQGDFHFVYGGAWQINSNAPLASGGSFRYLDSTGSVTVKFKGTSLSWIAKKSPAYGKAQVVLDGRPPVTVDLYSPDTKWDTPAWQTGTLEDTDHTVKISWTGQKRLAATDANISVDAFEVFGILQ